MQILGVGASATVYLVYHEDREVALKLYRPVCGYLAEQEYGILRELSGTLGIPEVYGVQNEGEKTSLLLEYIPGETLSDLIWGTKTGFTSWEAWLFIGQVFLLIAKIWSAGYTHNDLHPGNLIWSADGKQVYVIDFAKSSKGLLRYEDYRDVRTIVSLLSDYLSEPYLSATKKMKNVQTDSEVDYLEKVWEIYTSL